MSAVLRFWLKHRVRFQAWRAAHPRSKSFLDFVAFYIAYKAIVFAFTSLFPAASRDGSDLVEDNLAGIFFYSGFLFLVLSLVPLVFLLRAGLRPGGTDEVPRRRAAFFKAAIGLLCVAGLGFLDAHLAASSPHRTTAIAR